MSLEKLKQQIQEGALSGVYAFCGAEDYLKRHYIDLIRRKLVPDPEDPLNFVRLYYREATAAQVLDFAFGLPVFAEKKLLLLELLDTDAPAAARNSSVPAKEAATRRLSSFSLLLNFTPSSMTAETSTPMTPTAMPAPTPTLFAR